MTVMNCPYCGAFRDDLSSVARFCSQCGQPLPPEALAPGALLNGHYRVDAAFAPGLHGISGQGAGPYQGGFSNTIWKITDVNDGRPLLLREYEPDPAAKVTEVMAKLSAFARLRHTHIAAIVDMFSEDGRVLLVMEYAEGRTLEEILEEQPQGVPEARVLAWGEQLCAVLDYLHHQDPPVVYRDLRPSAVLAGADDHLRLIDFGYARLFDAAKVSDTHHLGTVGFVAPEMYDYTQTDARSDVYSLGVSLYRLLTNHNPADTFPTLPPARRLNAAVSPELEAVLSCATQLDPHRRYQSVAEMSAALRACAAGAQLAGTAGAATGTEA